MQRASMLQHAPLHGCIIPLIMNRYSNKYDERLKNIVIEVSTHAPRDRTA